MYVIPTIFPVISNVFSVADDPNKDPKIKGDPRYSLFVGRISYETTEDTLAREFGRFGDIRRLRLVKDIVSGKSRGYAFVEYEHYSDAQKAFDVSVWLVLGVSADNVLV